MVGNRVSQLKYRRKVDYEKLWLKRSELTTTLS